MTALLSGEVIGRGISFGRPRTLSAMADVAREVFKVPQVTSCCCGCSLETGTKIIAFIHIFIITGTFLAAFSYFLYDLYEAQEKHIFHHKNWKKPKFSAGFYTEEFMLTTIFGNVAFAACLLHGTYKKEPVYFEPWLILKTLAIILAFFNIGLFTVLRAVGHRIPDIFVELIRASLETYMFIVVYSLYKQYKSTQPQN